MLKKYEIICRVEAGCIKDAINEAIRMAKKHRCLITFEFNNVTITVKSDSDLSIVHYAWEQTSNKKGSKIGPDFNFKWGIQSIQ